MIGIDVVDVARFAAALERDPVLETRLFTGPEREYCRARKRPVTHLAGTLAAKEAVIKAAGLGSLLAWARRIEVIRGRDGAPRALVTGRPDIELSLSISHDGSWAAATALVHRERNRNLHTWLT